MAQQQHRNTSPATSVFSRAKIVDKVDHGWSFFEDCLVSAQLNLALAAFRAYGRDKGPELQKSDYLVYVGNRHVVNLKEMIQYDEARDNLYRDVKCDRLSQRHL